MVSLSLWRACACLRARIGFTFHPLLLGCARVCVWGKVNRAVCPPPPSWPSPPWPPWPSWPPWPPRGPGQLDGGHVWGQALPWASPHMPILLMMQTKAKVVPFLEDLLKNQLLFLFGSGAKICSRAKNDSLWFPALLPSFSCRASSSPKVRSHHKVAHDNRV